MPDLIVILSTADWELHRGGVPPFPDPERSRMGEILLNMRRRKWDEPTLTTSIGAHLTLPGTTREAIGRTDEVRPKVQSRTMCQSHARASWNSRSRETRTLLLHRTINPDAMQTGFCKSKLVTSLCRAIVLQFCVLHILALPLSPDRCLQKDIRQGL